jgi:hypothetical protein
MQAGQETRGDIFRRVIRREIDQMALDCDAEETPLQTTCLSYLRSEQAWLDKMLQTRHARQPGIIYGFYASGNDELQARAIEPPDATAGFIAVSTYCVVSFGSFFRAALAHRSVLTDFGNPSQELSQEDLGPGPHPFARPRDPERLLIVKLLTMMAMRFLTAHEMTHILNGHVRYLVYMREGNEITEKRHMLLPQDPLFRQCLEMDADSGALVDCMPGIIFAERDPAEPARIGCHPVYQKPEAALRLWLFAVYGVFRLLEDDAGPISIETSFHPLPLMRIQMVMGTLYEFLRREKLSRIIDLFPELVEQTIFDGETAYAAILNRTPDRQPWDRALGDVAQKQIGAVIREWRRVRPILERFARYPERLAALPEDSG